MRNLKRMLSMMLVLIMSIVSVGGNIAINISAASGKTTIYFTDNTPEGWIANDSAMIELVDNTNGHDYYMMNKINNKTWSVEVPSSANNITFNRHDNRKYVLWNSWSAGGRNGKVTYTAEGSSHGQWTGEVFYEDGFEVGDIIYLDLANFSDWMKDNAELYVNFTGASKKENGGNDVVISSADKTIYKPQKVENKAEEHIYQYIVTNEDEGSRELRFWRGNETTLWNSSVVLSYDDYLEGLNCIKITGWNSIGDISHYEYDTAEEKDTDNDSVPDYLESYFGTDISKEDTDGDGLSDYIELFVIFTDPLLEDTDADGVNDGYEDADGDGLTNLQELEINTDLSKVDTDSDNLSDYEEYRIYGTDPLNYDTDGDGVSDGKEVELGTDPLVVNANFSVSAEANEEDTVKVSVETVLSGKQVDTLCVEKYENELFFPTNMPGYIGGAYDFSVDGSINNATIKFEFDSFLLSDNSFDPIIYYFNEDRQLLEELDTIVKGNVATAKVNHFSKYILLNRKVFQDSFSWQDVWNVGDYSSVEIVLVIDDSGSMAWNDGNNQRLMVAKKMIENLPDNSKSGVVKFESSTSILTSSLTGNKELVKSFLTTNHFKSFGGTNMYNAINSSFSLFESTDESTLKMMVVLSDGETSDTGLHSSVISRANNNDVRIYTVGLGSSSSSYFENYLKPLANNTAGAFYLASNANQLEEIYNDINKKIDIETDSDGDGIADYYEDNMVIFNGITIKLDKNNPDSDGDGLLDGEEVAELNYQYNHDKTKVIVTGKLLSNPLESDSDYDGKPDSTDEAPLNNHFTGILTTKFATSQVSFDMDYRWFFNENIIYNKNLSRTSSLFASAVYHTNQLSIKDSVQKDTTAGVSMIDIMEYFGLNDAKTVELDDTYTDNHVSEVGLGYRTIAYNGQTKNIIAVIVRGTNGTIEEWSSNFDIGDSSRYGTAPDWKIKDNHEGFDIAANRIMKIVQEYVTKQGFNHSDTTYWITGHSRGAAIANIIGAYYERYGRNAYTYTFAAPNTTLTTDAKTYNTIFNIINKDDFVSYLPMEAWGYSRYGKTASVSIAKNHEKEWENITGKRDYNPDGGMDKTVDAMAGIISSGDPREEAYKYTCKKHGDGSDDRITIKNRGTTEEKRDNAINKIPSNALPFCIIETYDGGNYMGWDFDVCQTPAYFMQLIAAVMGGEIEGYHFVIELNIAKRYEKAKRGIAKSYLGGIKHPHHVESYYILAKNINSMEY